MDLIIIGSSSQRQYSTIPPEMDVEMVICSELWIPLQYINLPSGGDQAKGITDYTSAAPGEVEDKEEEEWDWELIE